MNALDTPHILVVDDDERLRNLLRRYLAENGYRVSVAADAAEARDSLAGLAFDLMVLDRMMPGEDGLSLARALRAAGNPIPILMLTAMGEAEARIAGLEGGADDYLVKPFEPRELVLRVQSIPKRQAAVPPAQPPVDIRLGRFVFDPVREILLCEGTVQHLTTAEVTLLKILAAALNQVLSREELALRVGVADNPRTVDVQITRLRKKIEDDPRLPRYIQTVRGKGYALRPDP
ncbi:MAG: response regulator transcription factor [Rhodospirillales bacterium]|nr:response regulator transcription factor [Rhodospirillales bacterium]